MSRTHFVSLLIGLLLLTGCGKSEKNKASGPETVAKHLKQGLQKDNYRTFLKVLSATEQNLFLGLVYADTMYEASSFAYFGDIQNPKFKSKADQLKQKIRSFHRRYKFDRVKALIDIGVIQENWKIKTLVPVVNRLFEDVKKPEFLRELLYFEKKLNRKTSFYEHVKHFLTNVRETRIDRSKQSRRIVLIHPKTTLKLPLQKKNGKWVIKGLFQHFVSSER